MTEEPKRNRWILVVVFFLTGVAFVTGGVAALMRGTSTGNVHPSTLVIGGVINLVAAAFIAQKKQK